MKLEDIPFDIQEIRIIADSKISEAKQKKDAKKILELFGIKLAESKDLLTPEDYLTADWALTVVDRTQYPDIDMAVYEWSNNVWRDEGYDY